MCKKRIKKVNVFKAYYYIIRIGRYTIDAQYILRMVLKIKWFY